MKSVVAVLAIVLGAALIVPFGKAQTAASVAGKWHFVLDTEGGDRTEEPTFTQDGDKVGGKWGQSDVKGTFTDGKLSLEFPMTSDEAGAGTLSIKGKLADDALTGNWAFQDYSGTFKATRVKDTASPKP
jgi:hypothetical protein